MMYIMSIYFFRRSIKKGTLRCPEKGTLQLPGGEKSFFSHPLPDSGEGVESAYEL
jgi:hypothetical protein